MVKEKRYKVVRKVRVTATSSSPPEARQSIEGSWRVGFTDIANSGNEMEAASGGEEEGDRRGVMFSLDTKAGIDGGPHVEDKKGGEGGVKFMMGTKEGSGDVSGKNSGENTEKKQQEGQEYKYANFVFSDGKALDPDFDPAAGIKEAAREKEREEEKERRKERKIEERKEEEHEMLSKVESERIDRKKYSRGSIMHIRNTFDSYIKNTSNRRGSLHFVSDNKRLSEDEKARIQTSKQEYIVVDDDDGKPRKHFVIPKPSFMTPIVPKSEKNAAAAADEGSQQNQLQKRPSMMRRISDFTGSLFGRHGVQAHPAPLKADESSLLQEMVPTAASPASPGSPGPPPPHNAPTIEEGDEEEKDTSEKEQNEKDMEFLLNADNEVEEVGEEEKKQIMDGNEVPPPLEEDGEGKRENTEDKEKDTSASGAVDAAEKTASESSSASDDVDSEEEKPGDPSLAARKREKRKQKNKEEAEAKEKGPTAEGDGDGGGEEKLTRNQVKKQERQRRRLASVHAIPAFEEKEEEKPPEETIEEKMAKQKAIDEAALDAADRMKKENEEFLRKLRGGDDEDKSVDSQGRELSDTVVDTINGSSLFKFERYFIYLQFTSLLLTINVRWPQAFCYSFGLGSWLTQELHVMPFHLAFDILRFPELVDIVDLAEYYWLVNFALKLCSVVIFLSAFFNFWVIKDYTDPKYTDNWIMIYIDHWWNIVLFWKSGFMRCVFFTGVLWGIVVAIGSILWVAMDQTRGVAFIVSGSLYLGVWLSIYIILVQAVRIAFKRKTKNNEYYTMRIMTKNVVEAKNQVCLFLLTALYLPTVVSVLKVILPMYDWNDTHTPDPRHDDSKFLRNVTTGSPTNYENVFYSVFPGAFASHGNNTLTAQVNYHIPCYLMAFPPNVSPNTNITTSIVDCNSPTGYSLLTATSLLVPIYVIGFPIMCIYLAWISYETMKDSNWFPNYTAQVMSYVNSNRHLRKEALKDGKIILLVKVKVLVFFQELLAGLKADIKGILLIIFMQETKQISKLQQRRIKLKKQATRQKEEKWLEARPEWKKTWDGFGNGGRFTAFIYIMIFANLAIMGHEREMFVVDFVTETDEDGNVVNNDDLLKYLNYFFAFIFFVEFVIKLTGMGAKFYFRDPFNMFDTFLVSFSIFEIFVVPYIFGDDAAAAATDDDAAIAAAEEEGGGGSGVGGAKALRMLKSVRILKMLRLGKILKTIKLKINRHLKRVEEMYSFDDYDWPEWRRKLKKKVTGNLFTNFIYLCIFVNLAGVFAGDDFKQAEPDLGYPMMYYSDRVFAVIFSFEMIVKWVGLGPKLYFMDPFEMLNFLLVCSGWAEIIAIPGSPDPPLEDAIEGGGGAGAAKMARLARFARFARFARVLRLLKIFKPQTQTAWRFQKSLEFKAMKVNQKFKSSCEEYVSTVKAFTVDHELVILTWDSLLDASSTVYLIQPFKHNFRYWKAIHFLEILSFTSCSIIMRRNFAPSEQLQVLLAILGFFQILHLVCLPYLFSRERKLDFFCRFCCMWNCGMGLLIDDGSLTETSAAFLILWGNLALLIIFSFVMQLPQVIKKAIYGLRNRVDSGVVKFLFKQLERKNLAMENVHTGLLTLQQWDNMVEDEQWMGFVGLSKTKPRNLLSARQRLRYMKWAAIRNMKLINIRDPVGVTVLHEAMARAEPEMCRWLVYHDRDFVDMEDDGRDTPLLIGLKECARALLACRNNPTDEWSWRRARFADIFLSEQIHGSHPNWNRFHYATLEDLAVPTLGELTQQLASAFDLHPPEGYVRVSNWNKYGANIMEYLAEMFVASRLEMDLYNRELGDIGFDSLLAMCSKMSVKHTSFTVPTNFKLFYNINVMKLDLRTNRLKHDAGMAIAKMLETNSTLEVLDLSDNAIDDDAGFAIFEALRHNHKVHTLKFNHNLLGPGAGKELAHCLKRNHVLKEVHCGYNSMGAKRFWKDAEVEEVIEGAGHDLGMSLRHNKSLTVLDLEGNRLGTGTGDAFAQMMRKNATLLQLNLGTNEILVDGGRYIANSVSKNKGLTYLNLEDNQLGPKAGMAFARSLKDNHVLAHLNLRTNKLGYKAGQAFAIAMMHNTSLISINLENNDFGPNVGKKWATAIQRNVGLTDIDFSNNDLGKHSHLGGEPDELGIMLKRALEANSQLTALNFSGCHFDSMTFIAVCGAFMKMKSLRVLKLDDLLLDEPSTLQLCNALEGFPVRNLSLARCEIGDSAKAANLLANCLRNLQTLVRLDLSGNILGSRRDMCEAMNEAFSHEGMHIRELNLRGNRFGPEGGSLIATGLGHLHTLEWLDVSDNQLDDDVCRELAESLREVISFGIVKRACSIKHFEGSNNPFGDEAASELIMAFYNEITNYIGLENCDLGPLTGHSIGKGLGRPTIAWEEMNISKNILKKEGANHIWWAMRKNHSLFRLNIESNRIGPQFGTDEDELGLHGISIDTALERNFTLRVLNMDDNGISAKAGEMFAATLSANKSLQHICFQNNDLDHVVGEYMGERLEYDRQIVSLNFNGNYFGWEGGKAIANALFTNRFLVSLDLGNNKLGENGARVGMLFAKALYQNNVLKSLKLAGNRFGAIAGNSFSEALKRNKTLTEFDFFNNRLTEEAGEKFLEMLDENHALVELSLCEVEIGMECADKIKEIISARQ